MERKGEVIVKYDRTTRLQTPSDRVLVYKILQERYYRLRFYKLLVNLGSTRLQTQTVVKISKCTLLLSLFPCHSDPLSLFHSSLFFYFLFLITPSISLPFFF